MAFDACQDRYERGSFKHGMVTVGDSINKGFIRPIKSDIHNIATEVRKIQRSADPEVVKRMKRAEEVGKHLEGLLSKADVTARVLKRMGGPLAGLAKPLLIAKAIANTYTAATHQLQYPFPFNLIAAGITIKTGWDSVKKIREQKFALGGPVMGPLHANGGVLAELEGGEHIWSRQEVSNAGGHQGVQALRAQQGTSFITSIRRHENTTRRAAYIGVTG